MPKQTTMTDALRKALNDAIEGGSSFREIERETGIVRQSLMPFARGEQSLLLSKADKLATYFGLELKPATKQKGN
jgi:transcriptional regulator with XRE-family HTH domain